MPLKNTFIYQVSEVQGLNWYFSSAVIIFQFLAKQLPMLTDVAVGRTLRYCR